MTASRIDYGTNRKGNRQTRRQWIPEGPPRALVLLSHGIGEHSGRYEHVGGQLVDAGFGVVALDQRGHGTTEGSAGHVERFTGFLDDIEDQLAEMRSYGLPVVLVGHSMGGLIATAYAVSGRPAPDLLVLSAPAIGSTAPGWQALVITKLSQLAPRFFVRPPFDAKVLSRDPEVVQAYDDDPLVRPGGSAQLLAQLFETIGVVERDIDQLTIPTLCLHGSDDQLVPAEASAILDGRTGVTREVIDGLRHEIMNEPEGPEIIGRIIEWIDSELAKLMPDSG